MVKLLRRGSPRRRVASGLPPPRPPTAQITCDPAAGLPYLLLDLHFQRVGDLIFGGGRPAAQLLVGATAGRTTLSGEGLQHQDGSSHLIAATVPNCWLGTRPCRRALVVILDHGAKWMI